jgi:hydroxymethylbilane synthase
MPLAAFAQFSGEYLHLNAAWGDPEARTPLVKARGVEAVADLQSAAALGAAVADKLRAGGAH